MALDDVQRITSLPSPPDRPEDAHKGTFGRVLVIAGSRDMSGAPALSGLGALRGGAGLVFVGVPKCIQSVVAVTEPSYLTLGLAEDLFGRMSLGSQDELSGIIPKFTAIAVGPGWGQSPDLVSLAFWLYHDINVPMVIDADGLNALSQVREQWSRPGEAAAERVLTPHPGEFARLLGSDIATVQSNREELAVRFARKTGAVVLLKGKGTVITDGQKLAVNTTGNNGMATAGSGDVLTGLIAALLGQGMSAFDAARLGAHLHGLAGDMAAADLSRPGMIGSDLPRYLALAWNRV